MERSKYDIYLSPPHLSGEERKLVEEALAGNWITTEGEQVEQFEQEIADYVGGAHVVLTNSGTSAIHLALATLGVGRDDFVICQSFTFVAAVNPVVYQGAVPVFVDSEPETWNMDPNSLEDAIKWCIHRGRKPKAIIYIHIYGMPAKIEEIVAVARRFEVPLIEDAAEAFGSMYQQKKVGVFGDISVFSFNGNKIITTSGGGAFLSKNEQHARRAKHLATQARESNHQYNHHEVGFNYRLSNICAAIGRGQLRNIEDRVVQRRNVYDFYKENLGLIEEFIFVKEPTPAYSNRWLSTVLVGDSHLAEKIFNRLRDNKIECRPLWKPMHLQPVFREMTFFGKNYSGYLSAHGLCLPSGTNLTEDRLSKICEIILSVL